MFKYRLRKHLVRLLNVTRALLLLYLLNISSVHADDLGPWFTGPLLAPSGQTVPKGHGSIETYGFYTQNKGYFNRQRRLTQLGFNPETIVTLPIFSLGVTDFIDFQAISSYVYQELRGFHSNSIGDTTLTLGLQAFKQQGRQYIPDLKIIFLETFPTGKFNRLSEVYNGANAVGLGGYRTGVVLAFQHLNSFSNGQFFRTRLSFGYLYSEKVDVHGVSGFGGTPTTEGAVKPGNVFSADLAGELTLDQNWVAVMEAYYLSRGADHFEGFIGTSTRRRATPVTVGRPAAGALQLLPAIEYNFTPKIGVIGGVWFPVVGRATPNFITYTLALNLAW